MTTSRPIRFFPVHSLLFFLFTLLVTSVAHAELIARWSTTFLVPGEETNLMLVNTEGAPIDIAKAPVVPGASVLPGRSIAVRDDNAPDGRIFIQILRVSADAPGTLQLPPLHVEINGQPATIAVPPIHVASTAKIHWYNDPIDYGVLWYVSQTEPYVNQSVKAAFKVFLPENTRVYDFPSLTKDGLAADHMLPAGDLRETMPTVRLRGQVWSVTGFSGDVSAIREGVATLAGKIPVAVMGSESPMPGMVFSTQRTGTLKLPPLELKALPLPPNPPVGYDNAVGRFTLTATTDAKTLSMNEPVAVVLTVRGTGNIKQISCPTLLDDKDWKLYPPLREVHTNLGEPQSVSFRVLMRPTAETSSIPSFALTFFDPADSAYKTVETAPIGLEWEATPVAGSGGSVAAAEPPPAGEVPVAEMTDIYDLVPSEAMARDFDVPLWLLSIFYLPALVLLVRYLWRWWKRRREATASKRERERILSRIGREPDDTAFLKGLGAFVETHIPPSSMTPELADILRRRDEEVFRPEAQTHLEPGQRRTMLQAVRHAAGKLALALALGMAVLASPATQAAPATAPTSDVAASGSAASQPAPSAPATLASAEQAYRNKQYSQAAQLASRSVAENPAYAYYLAGNAHYRLGQAGEAALAWARALACRPDFAEAKANLAFVQRKQGAILPEEGLLPSWLTVLTFRQMAVVLVLSGAGLALCLVLLLFARGRRHPGLTAATIVLTVVFAAAAAGLIAYLSRGDDSPETVAPEELYYVLRPTAAHNAADAASAAVIQLPASTPVRALAVRGSWVYVETFRHTRGWVQAKDLENIGPAGSPGFEYLGG